ncbi:MAG: hypothetical protein JNL28_06230 [Planctomycetes bacterium]|nr:hypothetical protein [Planctomycetota bacterium]
MARPVRRLWKMRTVVRRRHRTWMFSMSLASLGWAVWWTTLVILRFSPRTHLDLRIIEWTAGTIAAVGFLAALWCFRAKLAWLLIMSIALFANGSLLMMPWIVDTLRASDFTRSAEHAER